MRNISIYRASKYSDKRYKLVVPDVYYFDDAYRVSMSFVQEPELEEGSSAADISQYPLEDVLDKYSVYVSDFYKELNVSTSSTCYLEFASDKERNIINLLDIVGKHVYNRGIVQDGEECVELVVEKDE